MAYGDKKPPKKGLGLKNLFAKKKKDKKAAMQAKKGARKAGEPVGKTEKEARNDVRMQMKARRKLNAPMATEESGKRLAKMSSGSKNDLRRVPKRTAKKY